VLARLQRSLRLGSAQTRDRYRHTEAIGGKATVTVNTSPSQLVDNLARSGLVSRSRLDRELEIVTATRWTSPMQIAIHLVTEGLLTEWQPKNILNRKFKGFFARQSETSECLTQQRSDTRLSCGGSVFTDVDDATIESDTIQSTANSASGEDVLAFTDSPTENHVLEGSPSSSRCFTDPKCYSAVSAWRCTATLTQTHSASSARTPAQRAAVPVDGWPGSPSRPWISYDMARNA
jgi:hypothetical protein